MKRLLAATMSCAIGLACAAASAAGPEIFSLRPDSAPGGAEVAITGRRLQNTQQVLFVFDQPRRTPSWPYLLTRNAKFQAVSDRELKVVTPECLTAGETAIVAVITREGATVGVPASVCEVSKSSTQQHDKKSFYHVLDGGSLTVANGNTAVDSGGIVVRSSSPALHLVKKGGTLVEARSGIVFHEPGAIFGEHAKRGELLKFVEVPTINLSLGIEPFVFTTVPGPPGEAKSVPLITSIEPDQAGPGSIVRFRGESFTGALEVIFYHGNSRVKAGFRVLSDNELKVQVPDGPAFGKALIAVVNVKGVTLTTPTDYIAASGDTSDFRMAPTPRPRRPGERRP